MDLAKKMRKDKEKKRTFVRDLVTKIYLAILFDVGDDCMARWILQTKTFPEFIRCFVSEWLKDRPDADTEWIFGMCCMLTDFAESEKIKQELATPKDIFLWFSEYLEELFSKAELAWETSKMLSPQAIDRMIVFLNGLKEAVEPVEGSQ